jgi:glycerol-3-phosphate dehydrogenase (NAD(P)+)
MRAAVVGAGAWGTALANLLAAKGDDVVLWAYEEKVADGINHEHRNDVFLPDAPLSPSLRATNDVHAAVREAELIVSAAPSHAVRQVMSAAAPSIRRESVVISASKGLEPQGLKRMTEVLGEAVPGCIPVALSGPTFAREVYEQQPTAATVAATDQAAAARAQAAMSTGYFRLYTSDDPVGVELAGALKNVIAIAAGILEGLGLGSNPRAALITRGLAEMTRLGVTMGARPLTFAGLSGMGDLVLTATGPLSRNRSLGVELGKGRNLAEIQAGRVTVAEGVGTAKVAVALAERTGVELPIAREVARVLFDGKPARQAIGELMERALKSEAWGTLGGGARHDRGTGPGVLLDRRGLHAHRPQAARAALLGEPVPVPQSGQEPLGQPRLPAARDRAHHAGQAPAVHREVHHRRGARAHRALPPHRRAEAGRARRVHGGNGHGPQARAARAAEGAQRRAGLAA